MADKQIPLGRTAVYGLLPEADVQKIIDAVFRLMRETKVPWSISNSMDRTHRTAAALVGKDLDCAG